MPSKSKAQAKFLAMIISKKKGLTKAEKQAETDKLFKGTSKKPDKVEKKFPDKTKGKPAAKKTKKGK
jgi:hypothetical protein